MDEVVIDKGLLAVYVADQGNRIFAMGSVEPSDYHEMVRGTLRQTTSSKYTKYRGTSSRNKGSFSLLEDFRELDPSSDTIQLLIEPDGSHSVRITGYPVPLLDDSPLARYLVKVSLHIAKEKGWIPGQPIDDPRLFDRVYNDQDGIGVSKMYYKGKHVWAI